MKPCTCGIVICICASGDDPNRHTYCTCGHPQCEHLEDRTGPLGCGRCSCAKFHTKDRR